MPSDKRQSKAKARLTKQQASRKVREAVVAYLTEDVSAMPEIATAKLSSKHQITLPVAMVRRLGLEPGDRLAVKVEEDRIILRPQPKNWVEYYHGRLKGVYGSTIEEMDEYVRKERASWRHEEESSGS